MQKQNINRLFDSLVDDPESDIRTTEVIHGSSSLWLAELKAGKKLPAHYHSEGVEIYQVLAGEGTIDLGQHTADDSVIWKQSLSLQAGDVLEVPADVVHRLTGGEQDLRLIFFTPPSHLGDDRFFINE